MDDPLDPRRVVEPMPEEAETAEFVRRLVEATPRTWVTPAIVALNVGVFLLMAASGVSPLRPDTQDLFRFGADWGPATTSGQWWRLLTSTFVHIGLLHIGFNMWALWQSGRLAERFFGNGAFLFLYLVSGIGASVVSLCWNPSIVSAGASGSVFGVFGGLLAVVLLHRSEIPTSLFHDLKKSTITVIAYNVLIGSALPGIDNAAHLGGLATGFALGYCLRRPLPAPRTEIESGPRRVSDANSPLRFVRVLPVVALVAAGAAAAKLRVESGPEAQGRQHFDRAQEAAQSGDQDRAMKEVEAALALQPDDPDALNLRGYLRRTKGDRDGAQSDFVRASGLAPTDPYPRKQLAWINREAGELRAAYSYFADVVRLDPADSEARAGRGLVHLLQGKPKDALADLDAALELDPLSKLARAVRPYALYDLQRWPEALTELQEWIEEDTTGETLPHLYVWAVRARTGDAAAAAEELGARFASPVEGNWRARISSFLLGGISQPDLFALAEQSNQKLANGERIEMCETWYFVGLKTLLAGGREHALRAFRKCRETNATSTPAWASAGEEIRALER